MVPRLPGVKPAYWVPCTILMFLAAVIGWRIALPFVLVSGLLLSIVAPALTLAVYLRASFIVWKLAEEGPRAGGGAYWRTFGRRGLGVPLAWLTTYGMAWVIALINTIDLYNALPKKPPDC